MRIALVGTFGLKPKATVSTRAIPLAEALIEKGHDTTVVTPPWDNPDDSGKEISIGRVRVLNTKIPAKIPLLWYFLLTWRLLRQTLSLYPDVVHIFKPKGFAGLVASCLWMSNLLGITSIRIVVDTDDWEGTGGWNEIGTYTWTQRLFFPFHEKWVLRQAEAITVASRALQEMVSLLCKEGKKVFYLPNSVGPKSAYPETELDVRGRHGLGESPVILLYTRFFEFGVNRVLDVLEEVLRELPNTKLIVVGKGFFEEEKELDRLACERGLAPNVIQTGWLDERDLPSYFSAADVAIYPFDDTLINRTKCSVKLLDLLGAGVPVVADRVGQNSEYIVHGETGILTQPGNSGEMAQSVVRLMVEREKAKELGQKAQRRIRSEYTWEVWSTQALRAYEHASDRQSVIRMILAWLPVVLWMGAIFYMSAQPQPPHLPEPVLQTIAAKLVHLGEYALLAVLIYRAYRLETFMPGGSRNAIVFAAVIAVVYAASDEFHQSFVPNRNPSPVDVLIDALGASVALALIWRDQRRRRPRG